MLSNLERTEQNQLPYEDDELLQEMEVEVEEQAEVDVELAYLLTDDESEDNEADLEPANAGNLLGTPELNDMVRNMNISKDEALRMGQTMKSWNCLKNKAKIYHLRSRDKEFRQHFSCDNVSVYCSDIE